MKSGRKISPAEIAVAATVGMSKLKVCQTPKIAIISTGDELVDVEQTPLPHQIRMSNAYALQQALLSMGIKARKYHLRDHLQQMRETLGMLLQTNDVLILSGGVSKGKADFVPQILEELGVIKHFHLVLQRPGKPIWFGSQEHGPVVFALPGNPVSSFMCFHRYAKPWIEQSMGQPPAKPIYAMLTDDVHFKPNLTYFMQVKTFTASDGRLMAQPIHGHGSGDLTNLLECDAFAELPIGKDLYEQGEIFEIIRYR
jgi:molybdopterin molybdotransferase